MSWTFQELKARGNAAVSYALTEARQSFHDGRLDQYAYGSARGQILIAHCDLFADTYIVQSARNEIDFLFGRALDYKAGKQ